jgi:CRP-like cAMP-binding protein
MIMEISDQVLKKIPIFSGIKEEHLENLKRIIQIQEFPENAVVIRELLNGEVEVSKSLVLNLPGLEQKEKSLTKLSADGFPFFGEMVLFDDKAERTATVITTTQCLFAVLKKSDILNLAETNSEIGYSLFKNIASVLALRLKKANNDILKLTTALSLILSR